MNPHAPYFTIITATRNVATTLPRLLASLAEQTCRDFVWVSLPHPARLLHKQMGDAAKRHAQNFTPQRMAAHYAQALHAIKVL